MNNTTYSFFERFREDNFCLLYDGRLVDDVTDKIIDLSEVNFEHQEDYSLSKKKVSFLLAECFQNIIRHGGKVAVVPNIKNDFGFFLTRNLHGIYFITSGNLIKNENVAGLKAQLNEINSLDQENLKALYLDVLANKGFSQKGGAGLGLIEIARKSGQKIEYVFDDFNNEYSVFYNQVMLKPPIQYSEYPGYHIIEAMQCHKEMIYENIIMIQKGDFSHSSIYPVLEILQKNISEIVLPTSPKKEVYHVLVELLQNVGRYGAEKDGKKEGIFIIKKSENGFTISTGNHIVENQKVKLDNQIKLLNSLNKKELKGKYLESLEEENQFLPIELIDVARRSKELIQYNFQKTNTGRYFFTISVTV